MKEASKSVDTVAKAIGSINPFVLYQAFIYVMEKKQRLMEKDRLIDRAYQIPPEVNTTIRKFETLVLNKFSKGLGNLDADECLALGVTMCGNKYFHLILHVIPFNLALAKRAFALKHYGLAYCLGCNAQVQAKYMTRHVKRGSFDHQQAVSLMKQAGELKARVAKKLGRKGVAALSSLNSDFDVPLADYAAALRRAIPALGE